MCVYEMMHSLYNNTTNSTPHTPLTNTKKQQLKLTGNCMQGSRPILSFDSQFSSDDPALSHLQIIKHLMMDVFGTPRGHPKSKPFVDRVMAFYYADGKVRCKRAKRAKHMRA